MMRDLLLVGVGGFAGSVTRHILGGLALQVAGSSRFPWGTLVVNVLGCLIIGALYGAAETRGALSSETRLLIVTGVLGGFTTFSAFGYETFGLARTSGWGPAAGNIVLQLILGLGAVWVGHRVAVALATTT